MCFSFFQITITNEHDITKRYCGCTAGEGFCQHEVGLLYLLTHYQYMQITKVPEIHVVSSTSRSQQWHIPPRPQGFATRPVSEVAVLRPAVPSTDVPPVKARKESGIRSTLYSPIEKPLSLFTAVPQQLLPTIQSKLEPVQWFQVWSPDPDVPLVDSKFGPVPRGSIVSYQQKSSTEPVLIGPAEPPPFCLPDLHSDVNTDSLPEPLATVYSSLKTTVQETFTYEKDTRPQNKCQEWFKLQKHRPTSSNF